ncbi:MgtC/SapB family protein [Mycoplasmatota bacterium]|nr:MgtC/SapB family protein [Mycoplasmatota bacterium]
MLIGVVILFVAIFIWFPNGRERINNINFTDYLENVFKILIAAILGGLIGLERGNKNRPAGLRTHTLVSVGACIVMITSFDIFERYHHLGNFDPARLGAQVISGIGFLGAGTIIRNGINVKGLTTAASLWVVACIGLTVGSGMYLISISAAIIVYFTLFALGNFELRHMMKNSNMKINVLTKDKSGQIGEIGNVLGRLNIKIANIEIQRYNENENDLDEEEILITFTLMVPYTVNTDFMLEEIKRLDDSIDVEVCENLIIT